MQNEEWLYIPALSSTQTPCGYYSKPHHQDLYSPTWSDRYIAAQESDYRLSHQTALFSFYTNPHHILHNHYMDFSSHQPANYIQDESLYQDFSTTRYERFYLQLPEFPVHSYLLPLHTVLHTHLSYQNKSYT